MRIARGAVIAVLAAVAATALAAPADGARELDRVHKVEDGDDAHGRLDIASVAFGQRGRDVLWRFSARSRWDADDLAAEPGRSVCLLFPGSGDGAGGRLCVQRSRHVEPFALHYAVGDGAARGVRAEARRHDGRSFSARFAPEDVGLRVGHRYRWRVETRWRGGAACASPCEDSAPDEGDVRGKVARTRPIACVASGAHFARYGSRARRVVALTFDDGPWPYTPAVLDALERRHVPATFFLIGRQVRDGARWSRRALRDGDVVGNHTWDHADVSAGGAYAADEMERTSAALRRYLDFDTCLFRAPYNAYSGAQVAEAWSRRMKTVQYDVDPDDWQNPGADAIRSRVVGAVRPGSIVLLHDGGGDRSQTVAALPRIIDDLRARDFSFATVPDLLGMRVLYGRG